MIINCREENNFSSCWRFFIWFKYLLRTTNCCWTTYRITMRLFFLSISKCSTLIFASSCFQVNICIDIRMMPNNIATMIGSLRVGNRVNFILLLIQLILTKIKYISLRLWFSIRFICKKLIWSWKINWIKEISQRHSWKRNHVVNIRVYLLAR